MMLGVWLVWTVIWFGAGILVGALLTDCRASREPLDPEVVERWKARVR